MRSEALLDAADPGEAFFGFFGHLVARAPAKIAITEALLDAGGDRDGDAARASDGLRRAVGALLQRARRAGAVRDDVELPEVYALLAGISRAAARAPAKIAITEALLDAGAVRDDVELPEVYALLAGISRAAARARLDEEARARLLAVVFDGLAPRAPDPRHAAQAGKRRLRPGP